MTLPQYDWIAHHAEFTPAATAMTDLHSGRRYTYGQMHRRVDRLAAWLVHDVGVAPGDRISVLAHNTTDTYEIFFAGMRAGVMVLPLNWRLAVPELEFILNDAATRLLIHGTDFAAPARELERRCGIPRLLEMRDGAASDYEAIMDDTRAPAVAVPRALDDVWVLMYTSGTTGRPKGAQLTYQNHLFNNINCT
ncbi:MAG: class I adenylate-forming enzyme family protein, partial [Gammaproteobacteria bacterium]